MNFEATSKPVQRLQGYFGSNRPFALLAALLSRLLHSYWNRWKSLGARDTV
ncbi:hypothetical protein SAMN03159407_1182 [Rhizobium sp. NFR12]|nr:hypothetical protein SAMN03159407_1182 [Rhizobium sp. NFR12]